MTGSGRRADLPTVILDAADGRFPAVDGRWSRAEPWRDGTEGVVAFTGHAVLAVGCDVRDGELDRLGAHGFGGAHDPRFITALAGSGPIGVLDVLMVARGTGGTGLPGTHPGLVQREDLRDHPRVQHAAQSRDAIAVLGWPDRDDTSVVTLARGIAGLPEIGLELMGSGSEGFPGSNHRSPDAGRGAALVRAALATVPLGEVVLASVSPGNARSLRLFLRVGFSPIGSVQLWTPRRDRPGAAVEGADR